MITVTIKNDPYTIKVSGHANYEESGKDIVCSSVSTAVILSSNLIERFGDGEFVEVKVSDGYFNLTVNYFTQPIKTILDNLVWTLEELKKQYPKYIKIKKEG